MALTRKVKSGLTQAPFDTYIGEPGQIFFNNDTGEIRISDGATPMGKPVYVAVTSANIGDLVITGASITTLTANEDLDLVTNGTGNVNVYGSFKVHSDGLGSTVSFDAAASGLLTINAPNPVPSGSSGALNIVGSADGSFMPVTGPGGMVHITGNPDTLARVTIDGFLTASSGPQTVGGAAAGYGTIAMRTARGTPASPLPVLKDDLIGNYSALGWVSSSARYSPNQVAGLQFFAAETFTNASATGTYAQFRLAPTGSNAGVVSTSFFANGIVTGNVVASNVTVGATTYANSSITSTATAADFTIGLTSSTGNLILNRNTNFVKDAVHQGNIRYDQTQNNATVTQLTSKATAVTANGRTGQITTASSTLAKGAAVSFTVNNSYITSAKDIVIVNVASGASVNYSVTVNAVNAAGSFVIVIANTDSTGSGANATDTLVLNFAVIKVN